MDNFRSSSSEFNAASAKIMATSANNQDDTEEVDLIKASVTGTIRRYADHGRTTCEWPWPINIPKNVKKKIFKHLKELNFKVSKTSSGKREGLVIKW